jgi:peroxiredoxin
VLGLSGIGQGAESPATVAQFKQQTGVTFPLLLNDMTKDLYANSDGSITPYPLDVIVDRNGTIVYLRHEFDSDAMQATIEQLLAAP